jgi:hypothetical protein
MQALMSKELARAGRGHAPGAWRVATGRALVRVGVLVSGTTLEDSIVVVRRHRAPGLASAAIMLVSKHCLRCQWRQSMLW